jgi:hypothetical protein
MRLSPYAAAVAMIACASAQAGTFIPLQTPLGQAVKFSQNGEYLSIFVNQGSGVRWTRSTGVEEALSGLNYSNGINNLGVVAGSVALNGGDGNGGNDIPALLPIGATAPTELALPADTQNANVYDVSDDGSAVGLTWTSDFSIARAYYYSSTDDAVIPLPVDSPDESSRANSISADGSVIVGWNADPQTGGWRGVVWKDQVATYPTVTVDGADINVGDGSAVSGNGQWAVGNGYPTADGSSAAWLLNVQTGELTAIPGIPFAFGVSDDGKTVVGASGFFDFPPRAAYIWTEADGTVMFTDYMASRGIDYPTDWGFEGGLTAVSGDGSTVAGWTRASPNGMQSFVVTGVDAPVDALFADGFDGAAPVNPVQDESFEQSVSGSGPWASTSTNFGTALCTVSSCGTGGDTAGPRTGAAWAWFGGVESAAEEATVSQSVTIPSGGSQFLNFWLWIGAVGGSDSVLTVSVDGTEVASYPEPAEAEAGYTQRSVDVSAYADDAAHTIEFRYVETAGISSNYSLDDVTIDAGQPPLRTPVHATQKPQAGTTARKRH